MEHLCVVFSGAFVGMVYLDPGLVFFSFVGSIRDWLVVDMFTSRGNMELMNMLG